MDRKTMAATDVRWFGNSPRITPHLFGKRVTFHSPQGFLKDPDPPLPNRPRRPWLRLLVAEDAYADMNEEASTGTSIDKVNWVDFYGESYSFREKKLVISWSSRCKPSGRTEFAFPPEKSSWEAFDETCKRFIRHASTIDDSLAHTLQHVQEVHIKPHPLNPYNKDREVLLFAGGLWLSYNLQVRSLTEMVEYLNNLTAIETFLPELRPIYNEQMIFTDQYLQEGALKSSSLPHLPLMPKEKIPA